MTRSRMLRWFLLSVLLFLPAFSAFAETIELVTYYPAPGNTGDQHARSLTVGTGYSGIDMSPADKDGVALIYDKLWIGQGYTATDPAALRVVGFPGVADKALFLPGAGGGTLNVGIGTAAPAVRLDIVGPPVALIDGTRPLLYTAQIISGTDVEPVASGYGVLQMFRPITGRGGMAAIGGIYNGTNKDNDTGLAFYTNSETNSQISERVRITSAGNVGIGINIPQVQLDVAGTGLVVRRGNSGAAANDNIYLKPNDPNVGIDIRSGGTGGTPYIDFCRDVPSDYAMRLILTGDHSLDIEGGSLGIGIASPEKTLHVRGNGAVFEGSNLYIKNPNSPAGAKTWGFIVNDVGGTFNISRATDAVPSGGSSVWNYIVIDPSNNTTTVNGFVNGSDARLKTDIAPLSNMLGKVTALQGVRFRWKKQEPSPHVHMGLLAQDVEKVFPEMVYEGPDGMKSIASLEMIGVLTEAVKELKAENETLRRRVETLEKKPVSPGR